MSETLDLPPQHWATLCRLLALYLPNAEVIAFGSRVKGTHWEASGIDLVVRSESEIRKKLSALRQALSENNIPLLVQIHDWAKMPTAFQEDILR
ncbi:nucleotidyltransferase domain-containing protein [Chitinibacter sp. SCUT-21]|uniref:nucleotidyltransferase family protein n=1 Tax=Chitinibacter sp. SCUT-21 TaxID=2970891 RepID=UPI0035A6B872